MSDQSLEGNDRDKRSVQAGDRYPQSQMANGRKSEAQLIQYVVVLLISVLVVTIDLIFTQGTNHV
jgi:hypothetical protein